MSVAGDPLGIPLFGQNTDHSFVPPKISIAVARCGSQGRPSGRRASASRWTAATTMASLRVLRTILCIAMSFASPMLLTCRAHAERASSIAEQATAPQSSFAAFITEASQRFAIPEHWIRAMMRVESSGRLRARSRKGAMGLMQIMPQTWAELRARYDLGTDPYDPKDNILAGAAYIRELHDRYGAPGFLAAYNAGPRRYENHLATGRSLPSETQDYVATLAPTVGEIQSGGKVIAFAGSATLARSPLFVARNMKSFSEHHPFRDARPERRSSGGAVVDLSALVPQSGNLFVHRAGEGRSK